MCTSASPRTRSRTRPSSTSRTYATRPYERRSVTTRPVTFAQRLVGGASAGEIFSSAGRDRGRPAAPGPQAGRLTVVRGATDHASHLPPLGARRQADRTGRATELGVPATRDRQTPRCARPSAARRVGVATRLGMEYPCNGSNGQPAGATGRSSSDCDGGAAVDLGPGAHRRGIEEVVRLLCQGLVERRDLTHPVCGAGLGVGCARGGGVRRAAP